MAEANGSAHAGGKGNGASRKVTVRKPGFIPWSISLVARLSVWAAIFTVLFRCPSTLEECDETSPFVCKYYFQAKNIIHPHAKPHYDQYVAPYVEIAQPYYDTVQTNVLLPARDHAVLYGKPWVVKGRDYALAQWEVNGQPRIAQLHAVSKTHYDKSLAPHVAKAATLAEPYYLVAKDHSVYAVEHVVYPAYEFAKPYAQKGYDASHHFAVTTALPAAQWIWVNTNAFLDRAVWPQLRVVYVESVEPQLVRIGERLGRYKSHAKSKVLRETSTTATSASGASSSTEPATQSSYMSKPPPQSTEDAAAEPTHSVAEPEMEAESVRNPVEAPEPEENENDRQRKVREMVAQDLESWQEKFASQAEQGAAEIEDSVDEISRGMIDDKANPIGASLISQLQETITTEIDTLKERLKTIVSKHLEGAEVDTQEETVQAVRAAGVAIKAKAQVIRGWREQYDEDLQSSVLSTADVHFAILDETRSLALQQIGMKWAWTDGITYKDWAKYHDLKSTLSDWTDELKQLIVTHPTLLEAQDAAAQVEDRGMTTAAAAAKELARLKDVVQVKIQAEDTTDEFDGEKLQEIIEEKARLAEEARLKAEEEARLKAEEEARLKAEEEARLKAEEEARLKAEEEARLKAEEEARLEEEARAAAEAAAEAAAAEAAKESVDVDDEPAGEEDERIHSVKESSESKPLVSEDVSMHSTAETKSKSASSSSSSAMPSEAADEKPSSGEDAEEDKAENADEANEESESKPASDEKPAKDSQKGAKLDHGLPVMKEPAYEM